MNKRIFEIRKSHKLTQDDFGKRINVSKNFVWMLEKGDREPSERTIKDICREFNVNETWLRTGKGEMFSERSNVLENYLKQIGAGDDEFIKEIVIAYMKLSDSDKEALKRLIDSLAEKRQNQNEIPLKDRPFESLTIDEKVELYRQQLEEEEKNNKNKKGIS